MTIKNNSAFLKFSSGLTTIGFALREAFIPLVPFFILTSISTLILAALLHFNLFANVMPVQVGVELLKSTLPIVVLVSFTYQLAKVQAVDVTASVALSLSLLITLEPFNSTSLYGTNSSFLSLLIPIFSTPLLSIISSSRWIVSPKYAALDDNLRMIYRYTPAFIICYVSLLALFVIIKLAFAELSTYFVNALGALNNHIELMLFIRTIVSHLITFLGVHGSFMFDIMVNPTYLKSPLVEHFTAKNLIDTFVIFGGVGSCLALAISILIHAKDQHAIKISKISMPFLMFNITEILLYGLPIVLNKKLFIPFIVVPLINLSLALLFLHYVPIEFSAVTLPWTTPIFINAYLATDGNWSVILFQLFLLGLDIFIYMSFVKSYIRTQNSTERFTLLTDKLNISSNIQSKRGIKFQQAQTFLVNAHIDTDKIIQLIIENELTVFYQPIVNIKLNACEHFEALLRLRMQDGSIVVPHFLPTLEQAGLSTIIDLWVCRQVRNDLLSWQAQGYNPKVSVNIHPDTLLDDDVMQQILFLLAGFNVQFELIERAFLEPEKISHILNSLKNMHFELAIDDFGTGYSTLQSLQKTSANTIKFDKQLLDVADTDKGYKIYNHASQMCNDLGYNLVAEGVETEAQLTIVKNANIANVQGWYFAPALPLEKAKLFADTFNKNSS